MLLLDKFIFMYKKQKIGFTLIELLMVISIITLISSIFFSYIGSANAKSRDAVRLSDMKQINTATTMYYEDKGEMPISIGISNGVDASKTLVGAGYLSAEPKDPKTKNSYNFRTGTIGGKPVAVVSATYEKIYTTNSSGEEIPQQVGVIVGDIDMSNICILINDFQSLTGQKIDISFPSCDLLKTSNDQIIGVTSGHRSSRSNSNDTETDVPINISDCLIENIDKECPVEVTNGCYCEGGIYSETIIWYVENTPSLRSDEALAYCQSLNIAGYEWSLPRSNDFYYSNLSKIPVFVTDFPGYWINIFDEVIDYFVIVYENNIEQRTEDKFAQDIKYTFCVHY